MYFLRVTPTQNIGNARVNVNQYMQNVCVFLTNISKASKRREKNAMTSTEKLYIIKTSVISVVMSIFTDFFLPKNEKRVLANKKR